MKKYLAILLALCLVFSLVACGADKGDTAKTDTKTETKTEEKKSDAPKAADDGAAEDTGLPQPARLGYFDVNFDYNTHPTYKVGFISTMNDFLTLEFDASYAVWASRMNINYTNLYCTGSNFDDFLSTVQTYCDQGYDGLLLTPDSTAYARIVEVCDDNEMPFFACLGAARDYTGDGRLYRPSSGYEAHDIGAANYKQLVQWKEENYPDVDWNDVGYIVMTWSIAPEIQVRSNVQEEMWAADHPEFGEYNELLNENPKNFWQADSASGNADTQTCQNLTTQICSANPQIKVWLISGCVDTYAMGCDAAIQNLGLVDQTCITCTGGAALREQWDNGVQSAWRYAYSGAVGIFTEIPMNCLWAYMAGFATPDTIYPEWVDMKDKGDKFDKDGNLVEEHFYAKVLLASEFVGFDDYQNYLEWGDLYQFGEGVEGTYHYEPVHDLDAYYPYLPYPEN